MFACTLNATNANISRFPDSQCEQSILPFSILIFLFDSHTTLMAYAVLSLVINIDIIQSLFLHK